MDEKGRDFFKGNSSKCLAYYLNFENDGNNENLSKVDALVFMVGNDDDASQYSKSNALQVSIMIISSVNCW